MGAGGGTAPVSAGREAGGGGGMKTVNLLPDWYTQQQRQKGHLRLHLFIMILVGAGMIVCTGYARTRVAAGCEKPAELWRQAQEVGNPEALLTAQQAELKRLENLLSAYRELGNTIPMS